MHTSFLIGILVAIAVSALALVVFFWRIWRTRTEDREYLYFALTTLFLALHTLATIAVYLLEMGAAVPWSAETASRLIAVPSKPGLAFMLHFALRYARIPKAWRLMASVYVLMAVFLWLGATGQWWADVLASPPAELGTLRIHVSRPQPSAAARPFYLVAPVMMVATLALLFRRWRRQQQGGAAVVGGAVLCLAAFNDLLLGAGRLTTVTATPFGMLALGFGVALTVVSRYGTTSTELERSTAELQRRSKELEASYRELKRTQLQLVRSEQLAVVGELSAVIAHEVRNPLAIVGNAVASLHKKQTKGEDRKVLLNIISEEMARLDQLVSRLVHYARPILPKREKVDLLSLVERALVLAEGRRTSLDVSGDPEILGDASLLRQAFDNVEQNAVQATDGDGLLRVQIEAREREVVVRFIDDGEGMDAGSQRQALSPFFTTRPTGTGLGLPIVARIVEAHGGRLTIESEAGRGTAIALHLAPDGPRRRPRTRSWP